MRNRLGQLRRAEKGPAEKAGFAFFDGAVLAEELGDAAGHHEKRNQPVSSDRQIRNRTERPGLPFRAILF